MEKKLLISHLLPRIVLFSKSSVIIFNSLSSVTSILSLTEAPQLSSDRRVLFTSLSGSPV